MKRITSVAIALLVALPGMAAAQTTTDKVERKASQAQDKAAAKTEKAKDTTKDAWLTSKTKIALYADDRVSGTRVNVDTKDGVVTLRGKVGTADEKKAAEEVAKSVEGVKSVTNTLQVVPDQARKTVNAKDDDLKKSVKDRIAKDARLKGADIEVRSDNGVVTLKGGVKDIGSSARASELARSVPGVKAVKNELKEKS